MIWVFGLNRKLLHNIGVPTKILLHGNNVFLSDRKMLFRRRISIGMVDYRWNVSYKFTKSGSWGMFYCISSFRITGAICCPASHLLETTTNVTPWNTEPNICLLSIFLAGNKTYESTNKLERRRWSSNRRDKKTSEWETVCIKQINTI